MTLSAVAGKVFSTFSVLFILTLLAMLYNYIVLLDKRAKKANEMQFQKLERMGPSQAFIYI